MLCFFLFCGWRICHQDIRWVHSSVIEIMFNFWRYIDYVARYEVVLLIIANHSYMAFYYDECMLHFFMSMPLSGAAGLHSKSSYSEILRSHVLGCC